MLKLVVDSNQIISSGRRLDGVLWQRLSKYLRTGACQLVVPEVVLLEVVENARRTAQKKTESVASLNSFMTQVAKAGVVDEGQVEGRVAAALDIYEKYLRDTLTTWGARVEALPQVGARETMVRLVQRKRPFKEGATGLGDFLIWKTILSLVEAGHDVAFVTANYTDFLETKNGSLHPHMVEDLPDGRKVLPVYETIGDFLATVAPPAAPYTIDWLKEQDAFDVMTRLVFAARSQIGKLVSESLLGDSWQVRFIDRMKLHAEKDLIANCRQEFLVEILAQIDLQVGVRLLPRNAAAHGMFRASALKQDDIQLKCVARFFIVGDQVQFDRVLVLNVSGLEETMSGSNGGTIMEQPLVIGPRTPTLSKLDNEEMAQLSLE